MSETFKRTIEDFTCENCGVQVTGNGFTDHCPECLWSKHVDIHPGDRAATCGGLMKPYSVVPHKVGYKIFYRCITCGYQYSNRSIDADNITKFIDNYKPF